jgi:hypothetical protein
MYLSGFQRRLMGAMILGGMILLPILVIGLANGPADSYTGAPGEATCYSCHGTASGNGSLVISGTPAKYVLGHTYPITVTIQNAGQTRWGFELTSLGASEGKAGVFTITDPLNTQLSQSSTPNRDYVKQTVDGTFNGTPDGPVSWSFDWKAPNYNLGTITFYAAGLAADGDMTAAGDITYRTSITSGCCNIPGDANGNGSFDTIIEVTYIIKFLYRGGPAPRCMEQADVNGDGTVNIRDVTYLIGFLYVGGPRPICL